jgi:hypothetical protein
VYINIQLDVPAVFSWIACAGGEHHQHVPQTCNAFRPRIRTIRTNRNWNSNNKNAPSEGICGAGALREQKPSH